MKVKIEELFSLNKNMKNYLDTVSRIHMKKILKKINKSESWYLRSTRYKSTESESGNAARWCRERKLGTELRKRRKRDLGLFGEREREREIGLETNPIRSRAFQREKERLGFETNPVLIGPNLRDALLYASSILS